MDIVSRIRTFMNARQIGSTQFADASMIPRPTLSQILSGRNKKISDEVIAKIHQAYPDLSMMWLLFGEGNMIVGDAAPTSELAEGVLADNFGGEEPSMPIAASPEEDVPYGKQAHQSFDSSLDSLFFGTDDTPAVNPAALPTDSSKTIVSIMVLYSDNSYQSFLPR